MFSGNAYLMHADQAQALDHIFHAKGCCNKYVIEAKAAMDAAIDTCDAILGFEKHA